MERETMAISRELIVKPGDIRISIQCKLCGSRIDISHSAIDRADDPQSSKKPNVPVQCPSCSEIYPQGLNQILGDLLRALHHMEKFEAVSFRILDTHHG